MWKLTLQPANLAYFGLDSNYFEVSIRFQLFISLFTLYNSFVLLFFYFYYASHFVSYTGCIRCYLRLSLCVYVHLPYSFHIKTLLYQHFSKYQNKYFCFIVSAVAARIDLWVFLSLSFHIDFPCAF